MSQAAISDSATLRDDLDRQMEGFSRAAARAGRHDEIRTIAGVRLQISVAGGTMSEQLLPALAGEPGPGPAVDFSIQVWDSSTTGIRAPRLSWCLDRVGARGEIRTMTTDACRAAFFMDSGCLSILDLERRTGIFWVEDSRKLPSYERAAPLRALLHWALAASGSRLVHAAAVCTSEGAALLTGRGGSGKSTTAMLCLAAGFGYCGDDYVAVRGRGPTVVHTVYTSAKLTAASLEWIPFLPSTAGGTRPADEEKVVAMIGALAPDRITTSCEVRALILPRVAGGRSRISRTTGGEALRALAPTTMLQLPGNDNDALAQLADIARATAAWRLDLGDDRQSIPDLIARAVDESR